MVVNHSTTYCISIVRGNCVFWQRSVCERELELFPLFPGGVS